MVVSLPFGTRRISSSTSRGAGMTHVPSPQRLLFRASISKTLGKPLSSASFSCQVFFFFALMIFCRMGEHRFDGKMVGRSGPQHARRSAMKFGRVKDVIHATPQRDDAEALVPRRRGAI